MCRIVVLFRNEYLPGSSESYSFSRFFFILMFLVVHGESRPRRSDSFSVSHASFSNCFDVSRRVASSQIGIVFVSQFFVFSQLVSSSQVGIAFVLSFLCWFSFFDFLEASLFLAIRNRRRVHIHNIVYILVMFQTESLPRRSDSSSFSSAYVVSHSPMRISSSSLSQASSFSKYCADSKRIVSSQVRITIVY